MRLKRRSPPCKIPTDARTREALRLLARMERMTLVPVLLAPEPLSVRVVVNDLTVTVTELESGDAELPQ